MNNSMQQSVPSIAMRRGSRRGFTLVELLVVIAIMGALTALMLPRLRLVNKDRNIREAARVIGSKFAEASDRARRDGKAALTLVRNPNLVDTGGVLYASSTIYLSRAVPNYLGDSALATGTMISTTPTTVLRIAKPLEYGLPGSQENVVRIGDTVRISDASGGAGPVTSPVAYEITNIVEPPAPPNVLDLTLDVKSTQPTPPLATVTYVVDRQPKILRSSITDLPPGYIVDLRLSGPLVTMEAPGNTPTDLFDRFGNAINMRPLFYEKLRMGVAAGSLLDDAYQRVDIFFDSTGGISSVRTYRANRNTTVAGYLGEASTETITGSLQLFVSPAELDGGNPLFSNQSLWLTINSTSGGVNIGYNNPPLTAVDTNANGVELFEMLPLARATAKEGVSASQ